MYMDCRRPLVQRDILWLGGGALCSPRRYLLINFLSITFTRRSQIFNPTEPNRVQMRPMSCRLLYQRQPGHQAHDVRRDKWVALQARVARPSFTRISYQCPQLLT